MWKEPGKHIVIILLDVIFNIFPILLPLFRVSLV